MLLEKGEEVVGIDNLNTYYDPKLKVWRLSELKRSPNFSFNRMDITEIEPLRQIFKDHNPEAVINLAARAGVRASVENPWDDVDTNIYFKFIRDQQDAILRRR